MFSLKGSNGTLIYRRVSIGKICMGKIIKYGFWGTGPLFFLHFKNVLQKRLNSLTLFLYHLSHRIYPKEWSVIVTQFE